MTGTVFWSGHDPINAEEIAAVLQLRDTDIWTGFQILTETRKRQRHGGAEDKRSGV